MIRSVLVVGAGLAGQATARALRRQDFDGRITVVGDEPELPYDRPPLSKEFLAGRMTEADLALAGPGNDLDVEWVLGTRAVGLDPAACRVELAVGGRLDADAVIVATGSRARPWPGPQLAGMHTLRTLADARALRAELLPGSRLVVIGAGFIGAEVASTAKSLGVDVTILEAAPTPLSGPLGGLIGTAVAGLHERHGVHLHCGVPVAELVGTDRVSAVRLVDGREFPADVVVVGVGALPNVEWLAASGLDVSAGLVCSAVGATDAPGVYGVGDGAAWFDPAYGRSVRVEHWTDSRDRPAAAVEDLLGRPSSSRLRPPYFWSDQYGVRIQFAGHRRGDEEVTVEAGSADTGDLLAVYRRSGQPVAVLGMNQTTAFMRIRKSLSTTLPVPQEVR